MFNYLAKTSCQDHNDSVLIRQKESVIREDAGTERTE
jgi:hypothetical protein